MDMLTEMFGEESVGNRMGDQISIGVNSITASVNLNTMVSSDSRAGYCLYSSSVFSCMELYVFIYKYQSTFMIQEVKCDDQTLKQMVSTAVNKLQQSMMPIKTAL